MVTKGSGWGDKWGVIFSGYRVSFLQVEEFWRLLAQNLNVLYESVGTTPAVICEAYFSIVKDSARLSLY